MPKRKFALRSLFTGRAGRAARDQEVEDWDSDSDGFNDAHPFDPSEVNRPPKLDNRTENELRRACAIIVENLKPSGYDLEDTRMQSDILVENPELLSSNQTQPTQNAPAPQQSWLQDGSTRSSQIDRNSNTLRYSDKDASAQRLSAPPPNYSKLDQPLQAARQAEPQQVLVTNAIEQPEGPLAPLTTQAPQSRDVASPVAQQARVVKATTITARHDSSSSMSNDPSSDNGLQPISTEATSANYSPPASKHGSGLVRTESGRTAAAAAAAGAWKRQEGDRRRQEEMLSRNTRQNDTILEHESTASEDGAEAVRSVVARSTDSSTTTSGAPPVIAEGSSEQSSTVNGTADQVNGSANGPHSASVTTSTASVNGVGDGRTNRNFEGVPKGAPAEILDAPTLAQAYQMYLEQTDPATSGGDGTQSSTQTKRTSKRLSRDRNSKSSGPPLSPTLSTTTKPAQSWPAPPKPRYATEEEVPEMPPIPNKHQLDDSIVVKDFYQPSSPPRTSALRVTRDPSTRPVRPGDVEAADFDSFMSVLKDKDKSRETRGGDVDGPAPEDHAEDSSTQASAETNAESSIPKSPKAEINGEVSSADTAPEVANDDAVSELDETPAPVVNGAPTPPVSNGDKEANVEPPVLTRPSTTSLPPNRPTSEPLAAVPIPPPVPSQPPASKREQPLQPPVLSPPLVSPVSTEQRSPGVIRSSRSSISASPNPAVPSHSRAQSISKKSSGLKRILGKLGGGDRNAAYMINGYAPAKRKVVSGYAPGAYVPGYGFNGGIDEDDEWFDEQACAAPVVGFGRGY